MSIKEALRRRPQPVKVTEPELDDFVRRTHIAGYRNLYYSGALEIMEDLLKLINGKDPMPKDLWRFGTKQDSARWGKSSDENAQRFNPVDFMNFPKGAPRIWERTTVYSLPNGLIEVSLEWDQIVGYGFPGDKMFRMSVLSHPVSGDLLVKGFRQVLIHKNEWESDSGRKSLENAIAYVAGGPEHISRTIPNPQFR